MTVFIKIGGSLITDKTQPKTYHRAIAEQLASELAEIIQDPSCPPLLIGHGSGSFGHVSAHRYQTAKGVTTPEQWRGFAEVAADAAQLSTLLMETLRQAGLPILRMPPSSAATGEGGKIVQYHLSPIEQALAHHLIPLVHGDVAFDREIGGTVISTEKVFFYLARQLRPSTIILLGEVNGVYDETFTVFPEITPANMDVVRPALGGSRGTDVTGGMLTKVEDMLALAQAVEGLSIFIANGQQRGVLRRLILEHESVGTHLYSP